MVAVCRAAELAGFGRTISTDSHGGQKGEAIPLRPAGLSPRVLATPGPPDRTRVPGHRQPAAMDGQQQTGPGPTARKPSAPPARYGIYPGNEPGRTARTFRFRGPHSATVELQGKAVLALTQADQPVAVHERSRPRSATRAGRPRLTPNSTGNRGEHFVGASQHLDVERTCVLTIHLITCVCGAPEIVAIHFATISLASACTHTRRRFRSLGLLNFRKYCPEAQPTRVVTMCCATRLSSPANPGPQLALRENESAPQSTKNAL